eukprot:13804237-Alexandrium_andersonii.AAC.1
MPSVRTLTLVQWAPRRPVRAARPPRRKHWRSKSAVAVSSPFRQVRSSPGLGRGSRSRGRSRSLGNSKSMMRTARTRPEASVQHDALTVRRLS